MKTNYSKFLFTLIFSGLMSQLVFAGHNETVRSRCRTLIPQYVAQCHIALLGFAPLCYKRGGSCGDVGVYCSSAGFNGCTNVASSNAGPSGVYFSENRCAGFGTANPSALIQQFAGTYHKNILTDEGSASSNGFLNPVFSGNTVILKDLRIKLSSPMNTTVFNDFKVIVWMPSDDEANMIEDSTIDQSEILLYNRVFIKDNEFQIEGDLFTMSDFLVKYENGYINVSYIGGTKKIEYDSSIPQEKIALTTMGDIDEDQNEAFRAILQTSQESELGNKVITFPNPTSNSLELSFTAQDDTTVEYGIYNLQGKSVIPNKIKKLFRNEKMQDLFDLSYLSAGSYYLFFRNGENKVLKAIIKQ